jgi:hypothetical protein
MTEEEFRASPEMRSDLERILQSKPFIEASRIAINRRRNNEQGAEANLSADPIVSVRMNSQRIGAEGFLLDLEALCLPPVIPQPAEEATFQQDEAAAKLKEFEQ